MKCDIIIFLKNYGACPVHQQRAVCCLRVVSALLIAILRSTPRISSVVAQDGSYLFAGPSIAWTLSKEGKQNDSPLLADNNHPGPDTDHVALHRAGADGRMASVETVLAGMEGEELT